MTALSARAWPLSAARSRLLFLCILAACFANGAAQNNAATAVPASFAVQPLYGEHGCMNINSLFVRPCMPYHA